MEAPVPLVPVDPSGNDMLRDISTFLGALPDSDTSYSSDISIFRFQRLGTEIRVKLDRSDTSAVGGSAITNSLTLSHTFQIEESLVVLDICRMLVACPSWTQGKFAFRDYHLTLVPSLNDLIWEIFSLLRSSPSLSSLDIGFRRIYTRHYFYQRHLPTLLCENPFLETLTLTDEVLNDPKTFALCFSRNSVLKSCAIWVDFNQDSEKWEMALKPFTTSSKSEANVALKELVLQINDIGPSLEHGIGPNFIEALENLVRCNTTLEKLVFGRFAFKSYTSLANALAVNHTLKEFGCVCSVTTLMEILDVFIPDSSGHQANTHLTSLKLFPTVDCYAVWGHMTEVCRMLEFNSTLKHVEIGRSWRATWPGPITSDMLESMVRNALRSNTSLQSLVVVGYYSLLRVGGEWQMCYDGPCLSKKRQIAEYKVKLHMRR